MYRDTVNGKGFGGDQPPGMVSNGESSGGVNGGSIQRSFSVTATVGPRTNGAPTGRVNIAYIHSFLFHRKIH